MNISLTQTFINSTARTISALAHLPTYTTGGAELFTYVHSHLTKSLAKVVIPLSARHTAIIAAKLLIACVGAYLMILTAMFIAFIAALVFFDLRDRISLFFTINTIYTSLKTGITTDVTVYEI